MNDLLPLCKSEKQSVDYLIKAFSHFSKCIGLEVILAEIEIVYARVEQENV